MLNIKDTLLKDSAHKDSFSNNYTSIIRHFLLKPEDDKYTNDTQGVICDPPVPETNEKRIKEELIRCIWYGHHFKKQGLLTDNGVRVEIISPGYWNVEAGPDFHHAEMVFGDSGYKKGEVEVHVYSNDWRKHGHNHQESYNSVCLHVVMWNNMKESVCSKNGAFIPQVTLDKYLDAELDDLFDMINFDDYPQTIKANTGLCQKNIEFNEANKQYIGLFLDSAGDERILSKVRRFKKVLNNGTFEQTLYETIMEALGYKNNKDAFLKLANVLPYKSLQELVPVDLDYNDKVLYVQAALFGMSGLLQTKFNLKSKNGVDQESDEYLHRIETIWKNSISGRLNVSPMHADLWQFSKTRPANFPTRRIAAISHIVTKSLNHGILKLLLEIFEQAGNALSEKDHFNAIRKGVDSLFLELFDDYWSHYYTFNGKRISPPQRLLGKERIADILINVLIPILLLNSRENDNLALEQSLHLLYRNYPRLMSNSVTKFMSNRVFGDENVADGVVCNSRRQQGLHQIFRDFCDSDNFLCDKCVLYLILRN